MAPVNAATSDIALSESDYEYEYDENETETFYVDIDLTSTHGPIIPPHKKRKIQPDISVSSRATPIPSTSRASIRPRKRARTGSESVTGQSPDPQDLNAAASEASLASSTPVPETLNDANVSDNTNNDIQILDLDTLNPIISYHGHHFSCTWTDMIGTNLFFSSPAENIDSEDGNITTRTTTPVYKGHGFDLQAMSRIKLLGRRAKLTSRPGRRRRPRSEKDNDANMADNDTDVEAESSITRQTMDGRSLGTLRSSNPTINREIKEQARFLERLMDIKRAKGETDSVRTVFLDSTRRRNDGTSTERPTTNQQPQHQPPRSREEFAKEIEELNRKVVRGDGDALLRLEEIYEQMEDEMQQQQQQQQQQTTQATTTDAVPSQLQDVGTLSEGEEQGQVVTSAGTPDLIEPGPSSR